MHIHFHCNEREACGPSGKKIHRDRILSRSEGLADGKTSLSAFLSTESHSLTDNSNEMAIHAMLGRGKLEVIDMLERIRFRPIWIHAAS